jgi:hypothetical protein
VDELLSWAEIQRRYPDEWVLLVDEVLGEDFPVTAGRVAYHTPDRDEMYFTGEPVAPGLVPMVSPWILPDAGPPGAILEP